jgi:hypothetical protein
MALAYKTEVHAITNDGIDGLDALSTVGWEIVHIFPPVAWDGSVKSTKVLIVWKKDIVI